jgi:hypothetical protein
MVSERELLDELDIKLKIERSKMIIVDSEFNVIEEDILYCIDVSLL